MILLDAQEYVHFIPALSSADINTMFARFVLQEKVTGRVFADQNGYPASLYIQHPYGMSLLCGESRSEDFYEKLTAFMLNLDKSRDRIEWLQVYPASLYSRLEAILGPNLIKKDPDETFTGLLSEEEGKVLEYQRINYKFDKASYLDFKRNLPHHDRRVVSITDDIFDQLDGSVVPKHFWNNSGDFIGNGIGFTILENGIPISAAFSSFIIDNQLEIGIETLVDYRGAGLASMVCAALIDYCLDHGFEPVWACSSGNTGSRKLAEKLGFMEAKRVPYYCLPE